mgnify:CR=1 FL=1
MVNKTDHEAVQQGIAELIRIRDGLLSFVQRTKSQHTYQPSNVAATWFHRIFPTDLRSIIAQNLVLATRSVKTVGITEDEKHAIRAIFVSSRRRSGVAWFFDKGHFSYHSEVKPYGKDWNAMIHVANMFLAVSNISSKAK